MAQTLETLTLDSLDRLLAHETRAVLVEFSAGWCAPCKVVEPVLAAIARDQAAELVVVKVDLDASPELAVRHGVRAAPTMLLFRRGVEVSRRLGAASRSTLVGWLAGASLAA